MPPKHNEKHEEIPHSQGKMSSFTRRIDDAVGRSVEQLVHKFNDQAMK